MENDSDALFCAQCGSPRMNLRSLFEPTPEEEVEVPIPREEPEDAQHEEESSWINPLFVTMVAVAVLVFAIVAPVLLETLTQIGQENPEGYHAFVISIFPFMLILLMIAVLKKISE